MRNITLTILSLLVICIIFSSCSLNNNQTNSMNVKLEYDNKTYHDTDSEGRIIKSSWYIEEIYSGETEKVKAILNFGGSESKITVKKFKNENLNMFLFDDDSIYCEENFNFPDYRKNAEIDKIIITPNANTYPDEKNNIIIDKKEDIMIIMKTLIDASDFENYKNNSFSEKPQSDDSSIEIVYRNCPAVFYYGYISVNNNNEYGIYCIDVNNSNLIYTVDSEMLSTLKKYETEHLSFSK